MQFAIAALGLAAVVSASYAPSYGPPKNVTTHGPSYTTEVVPTFETYCPSATSIEHNGITYTVTEATTLTITNCPCTVTKPVYTAPPPAETPKTPETPNSPVQPPVQPPAPHYPSNNATAPAPPAYQPPAGTAPGAFVPPATTGPMPPAYTGAGSKASFGVAGVMAAAALIAAL